MGILLTGPAIRSAGRLKAVTCGLVLVAAMQAGPQTAEAGGSAVGHAVGSSVQDLLSPPPGVVVELPAPPASSAADIQNRTEIARQLAAQASAPPDAEIILPYSGGPLPPEFENPPPGTVVLLQSVPAADAK